MVMNRRVGMYQYLLMHIVTKYYFCFIEDDLEAALAKCEEVLSTFQIASSKDWETWMSNLTSSWDNIRKQLIEAVLSCEGLPSRNLQHLFGRQSLYMMYGVPKTVYVPFMQ